MMEALMDGRTDGWTLKISVGIKLYPCHFFVLGHKKAHQYGKMMLQLVYLKKK